MTNQDTKKRDEIYRRADINRKLFIAAFFPMEKFIEIEKLKMETDFTEEE